MRTDPKHRATRRGLQAILTVLLSNVWAAGAASAVEPPESCEVCGMDRSVFSYSRMVVEYSDSTSVGVCSVACAAMHHLTNDSKKITGLRVADLVSQKLTDAKAATWVIGGRKPGVMTGQPKWAFESRDGARAFTRENGGKITSFEKAWKNARKEAARMMRG